MSLIGMAVWDTEENQRTQLTEKMLQSTADTVNFNKHRMIICDNNSCDSTLKLYETAKNWLPFEVIHNKENRGMSKALNRILLKRAEFEHVLKVDNDVTFDDKNWLDKLEQAINRDIDRLGICGLKRRDLIETTWNENPWYKSEVVLLPHKPGEDWILAEKVHSCIGTCTLFNYKLLDTIGYSWQHGKYGFEDILMCVRAKVAGFYCCFLSNLGINHLDVGGDTTYQNWKHEHSGQFFDAYNKLVDKYIKGEESIYVEYHD